MYSKILTIDCKRCIHFKINENNDFICNWGRSKKKKKLINGKKDIICTLKGGKGWGQEL